MVKSKIRKHKGDYGNYLSYVVTLPKVMMETHPKLKNTKEVDISVNEHGWIILKPIKQ